MAIIHTKRMWISTIHAMWLFSTRNVAVVGLRSHVVQYLLRSIYTSLGCERQPTNLTAPNNLWWSLGSRGFNADLHSVPFRLKGNHRLLICLIKANSWTFKAQFHSFAGFLANQALWLLSTQRGWTFQSHNWFGLSKPIPGLLKSKSTPLLDF